jgi:L-alanine-DL-glutamate epimerase-like enolase superfamily enzyme
MKLGGLRPAFKVASIAESAGIQCMVGSMPELGIATMAGVHFAMAIPQVTYECELIGPLMVEGGIVADSMYTKTDEGMIATTSHKTGLGLQLLEEVEEALTH